VQCGNDTNNTYASNSIKLQPNVFMITALFRFIWRTIAIKALKLVLSTKPLWSKLLGTFRITAKSAYCLDHAHPYFCLSVCSHVQRFSHWTNVQEIWYWKRLWKTGEKYQIWFKSVKNIGHITRRCMYVCFIVAGDIKSP